MTQTNQVMDKLAIATLVLAGVISICLGVFILWI